MTTHAVSINGIEVPIVLSDEDLATARLMLSRCDGPQSRAALAASTADELAQIDNWADWLGAVGALAMARTALAVAEVHAEIVAGRSA